MIADRILPEVIKLKQLGEHNTLSSFYTDGDQVILNRFGLDALPEKYDVYPKDIFTVVSSNFKTKRAIIQSNSEPEYKIEANFNYLSNAQSITDRMVYVIGIQAQAHPSDPSTAKYNYLARGEQDYCFTEDVTTAGVLLFPTEKAALRGLERIIRDRNGWPGYLDKVIQTPRDTDCFEIVAVKMLLSVRKRVSLVGLFERKKEE